MCSRMIRVDPVPHAQGRGHLRAAQVEVAVLAGAAARRPRSGPRSGTAGSAARASTSSSAATHLDLAGGQVRVPHALGAIAHRAGDADHPLAAELLRRRVGRRRVLGVEHDLHDALAVAKVDERDAAVVAAVGHPPAERHLVAGVRRPAARRTCAVRIAVAHRRALGRWVVASDLRRRAAEPRPRRRAAPSSASRRRARASVTVPSASSRPRRSRRSPRPRGPPASSAPSSAAPRTAAIGRDPRARGAPSTSARTRRASGVPIADDERAAAARAAARHTFALERQQHPIEPHREPDPRASAARRAPRRARRIGRRANRVRLLGRQHRRRPTRTRCACSSRGPRTSGGVEHRTSTPAASSPARTAAKCVGARLAEALGDRRRAGERRRPARRRPCSRAPAAGSSAQPLPVLVVELGRGAPRGTRPAPRGRPGGTSSSPIEFSCTSYARGRGRAGTGRRATITSTSAPGAAVPITSTPNCRYSRCGPPAGARSGTPGRRSTP